MVLEFNGSRLRIFCTILGTDTHKPTIPTNNEQSHTIRPRSSNNLELVTMTRGVHPHHRHHRHHYRRLRQLIWQRR